MSGAERKYPCGGCQAWGGCPRFRHGRCTACERTPAEIVAEHGLLNVALITPDSVIHLSPVARDMLRNVKRCEILCHGSKRVAAMLTAEGRVVELIMLQVQAADPLHTPVLAGRLTDLGDLSAAAILAEVRSQVDGKAKA